MKVRIIPLVFLLFPPLFADEVRVEPLEYWRNASLWPQILTVQQLAESSLAASGLEGESLERYTVRLIALIDDFQKNILPLWAEQAERERGESILRWIHEEILTGRYRTDQTRMDVLLDRGDYNCVSSAVLYLILSRASGLDTAGEETTDHAFCTLRLDSGVRIDIETTTLLGFDPGTKKEFSEAFSGRTGFSYVEPGDYRRRKPASDKQMIALILQNRIALSQRKGEYSQAVGPAVDRWFFSPGEANRRDMNDAFRNHVSLLNGKGRFLEALSFLVPLSQELGLAEENRDLVSVLVLNQLISLTNENRLDEGEAFLEEWSPWLSSEEIREQRGIVSERRAQIAVDTLEYSDALAVVRSMKEEGALSQERANELLTWLHQNRALELADAAGNDRAQTFRDAMAFLDSLPDGEKQLPGIADHRSKYRQNWAVVIHNRWADLMNRGEYDKAGQLLDDALILDSTNSALLKDREFLKKSRP